MSRSTETIRFEIPIKLYNHFSAYIKDTVRPSEPLSVDYLLKCLAINRAISIGVLTELGEPNEFILPPKFDLDLSKVDFSCGNTEK